MKASSALTALALKVVGVIFILSFLMDCIFLLIPPSRPSNVDAAAVQQLFQQWQLGITTQMADRGIIPLLGVAIILLGYWIADSAGDSQTERKSLLDIRFGVLLLSSLLGVVYLVVVPVLHANNLRMASAEKVTQIEQQANQAESQLKSGRLDTEIEQRKVQLKSQLSELLKDDKKLNDAINSGQVKGEQATLLKKLKADPKAIDDFVDKQAKDFREQALSQVRVRQKETTEQITNEAWKSGLRTVISSVLLSLGYIALGWTGLRSMGGSQPSRRRAGAR